MERFLDHPEPTTTSWNAEPCEHRRKVVRHSTRALDSFAPHQRVLQLQVLRNEIHSAPLFDEI